MYDTDDAGESTVEPLALDQLHLVFREQLLACLEECARGRRGLFASREHLRLDQLGEAAPQRSWPEAEQLRELAFALQALQSQQYEQSGETAAGLLVDQFLDLCSIHGEADPGEARLARSFLQQIAGEKPC